MNSDTIIILEPEDDTSGPYSINEEYLEKKLHKHDYGRKAPQILASFIACLSGLTFGSALGWSGPVTYHEAQSFEITTSVALLVSMVPLGCCMGIIKANYIMKRMGPKKTLQIQAPFYISTWWIILLPNETIKWIARFLLGLLGITHVIIGDCLLKQTVHCDLAKYVAAGFNATIFAGVLMSHIFGYLFNPFWLTLISSLIPIVHFVLLFTIPESPVYLYEKSHTAAQKALEWYRGRDNAAGDMRLIRNHWEILRIDPETYKYMLYSKVVYKGILIVVGVTFYQVFSGYFIFLFYSINIWNNEKILISDIADPSIVAIYFFASKLFWGIVHARYNLWKVKKILICSCLICGLQQCLLSLYLFCSKQRLPYIDRFRWFPFIVVAIMIFFYDMGLNHYTSILIYDYIPFQVFTTALSISQVAFWLLVFINCFCFAWLIKNQSYYIFITVGLLLFCGAIYCHYFVVEPVGKSLVQIQILIGGNPIGNRGATYTRTVHANQANQANF